MLSAGRVFDADLKFLKKKEMIKGYVYTVLSKNDFSMYSLVEFSQSPVM